MEGDGVDESSSPFFLADSVFKWLDTCLDLGFTEMWFWESTLAEIERAVSSKKRVMEREKKERAYFDYTLANAIGYSIGRLFDENNKYPDIEDIYPSIFDTKQHQEELQKKQDEITALRFKQWAESFNKNFKKEVAKDE